MTWGLVSSGAYKKRLNWHQRGRQATLPTPSYPMISRFIFLVLVLNLLPIRAFGQGSIQAILIEGAPALDGNGVFGRQFAGATFGKAVINKTGQVAFTGQMKDTSGGIFDMQGLFLYEPGTDEVPPAPSDHQGSMSRVRSLHLVRKTMSGGSICLQSRDPVCWSRRVILFPKKKASFLSARFLFRRSG